MKTDKITEQKKKKHQIKECEINKLTAPCGHNPLVLIC